MISEKQFALSYASFWNDVLPMVEEYLRRRNRALVRFAPPLKSSLPPATRGVVNDLGFRLFGASSALRVSVNDLSSAVVAQCIKAAVAHIRDFRERSRTPVAEPDAAQKREAAKIANRLQDFFVRRQYQHFVVSPRFPGCGWLDESEGDVLAGDTLFEVKAGERGFRGIDVRQSLTYCALALAAGGEPIRAVCLLNPRTGLNFEAPLDALCRDLSGRSSREVLDDIIDFVSAADHLAAAPQSL